MASTFVDARFAGGAIVVESDDEYTGDGQAGVILALPGQSVWLFPREARALAHELQAYAAAASKKNAGRAGKSTAGEDQNTHEKDQS